MNITSKASVALAALALTAGAPVSALAEGWTAAQSAEPSLAFDPPASGPVVQPVAQERRGGRSEGGGRRGGQRDGAGAQGDGQERGDGASRRVWGGGGEGGNVGGESSDRGQGGVWAGRRDGWARPAGPDGASATPPPSQPTQGQDRGGERARQEGDQGVRGGQDWRRDSGQDRGGDRSRPAGPDGRDWDDRSRDDRGGTGGQDRNGGGDRDRNAGGRDGYDNRGGRRDYGGFRDRWDQNEWRRDWNRGRGNDWWRSDRGFRGYTGFRPGYYFAPNYGYYSVPRNYFGRRWYQGDYLPSIFWRYTLNDYRTYGLGYPPPGTQWVAVDTTIYLIDRRDGYIIEVIYDAWRW